MQRTRDKLPFLQEMPEWRYPKQLSLEQCSSETTARYKNLSKNLSLTLSSGEGINHAEIRARYKSRRGVFVDLTGGMGIDTWFLSEDFKETHYVEQDEDLCRLAEHNFGLYAPHIQVHHDTAEHFLQTLKHADLIYIDPARRSKSGSKVFKLEDCTPNVVELMPLLREKCDTLMLKLSPMIDVSAAIKNLSLTLSSGEGIPCGLSVTNVHVVAVRNEVKEVIVVCQQNSLTAPAVLECSNRSPLLHCVNLETSQEEFVFSMEEEKESECQYATETGEYIIEPNMAIMKAGAFKTFARRYGLLKLGYNTHLYTADTSLSIPGRVWRVGDLADKKAIRGQKMNILSRNYPLSADEIRKKYNIKDGGDKWLIATRIGEKAVLISAMRE